MASLQFKVDKRVKPLMNAVRNHHSQTSYCHHEKLANSFPSAKSRLNHRGKEEERLRLLLQSSRGNNCKTLPSGSKTKISPSTRKSRLAKLSLRQNNVETKRSSSSPSQPTAMEDMVRNLLKDLRSPRECRSRMNLPSLLATIANLLKEEANASSALGWGFNDPNPLKLVHKRINNQNNHKISTKSYVHGRERRKNLIPMW